MTPAFRSLLPLFLATSAFLCGCGGGGGGNAAPPRPADPPAAPTYMIGGSVSGLGAGLSLGLTINGAAPLVLSADGAYTFPGAYVQQTPYAVAIAALPPGQTCVVVNASGTLTATVTDIAVTCVTNPPPPPVVLSIGGTISGLPSGVQLALTNNGETLTVGGEGVFSLSAAQGSPYAISVVNNPAGQFCAVTNPSGVASANVSNIVVTCRAAQLSILTGSGGGPGYSDGVGGNSRFDRPDGNAVDAAGNVFVAEWGNNLIRKITPDGVVSTFAGTHGKVGAVDGPGSGALFCRPLGLAFDSAGFLYVTEGCNPTLRKISPAGLVSTVAGMPGQEGSADGTGSGARFTMLTGIAIDSFDNVYVADTRNQTVRKVTPAGVVTTLAGTTGVAGWADGAGSAATFTGPNGLAVDAQGTVYVADSGNHTVRKISPAGAVSTLAGTVRTRGRADGQGAAASFSLATPQSEDFGMGPLSGIAVDGSGTLFLSDHFNHTIRRISPAGVVTTVAGATMGYLNGQGTGARLRTPTGISFDRAGNLYVSEDYNYTVRKLSPSLQVTTLAGKPSLVGSTDGAKGGASFYTPYDVASDAAGNLYVADFNNNAVRKISAAGVTSTLAGFPGEADTVNGYGSAARFYHPGGVAVDAVGNVYVADTQPGIIRKIRPDGAVTTLAGGLWTDTLYLDGVGTAARFHGPIGITTDAAGNVYVADSFNTAVRKITPAGVVTTVNGRASSGIRDLTVDSSGNIYYTSSSNSNIKKISPDGKLTVLAGPPDGPSSGDGYADGVGPAARFSFPFGIVVDPKGNVYVADSGNCAIRMITPGGVVTTIAGVAKRCETHEGPLPGLLPPVLGLDLTPDGQLVITGNHAILRINIF